MQFLGTIPANPADKITKAYVDAAIQGLLHKQAVQAATLAALPANTYVNGVGGVGATLTAVATGILTIDTRIVALGDRVLVKNEVTGANNGIYTCTTAGTAGAAYVLTRATDSDTASKLENASVFVEYGVVGPTGNGATGWVNSNTGTVTTGTTPLTFVQYSGGGSYAAGIVSSSIPAAQPTGNIAYGAIIRAKREMLAMQGSASSATAVQPLIGCTRIAKWDNAGNGASTTILATDIGAPTLLGTNSSPAVTATNTLTRTRRMTNTSAATAGALAGFTYVNPAWLIGNNVNPGGFFMTMVFGCADAATVAGARQFCGMTNATAAPTNVEPATLINAIGVGHGAADTNLKLYCAGTTAQAAIDLGANFPANTLSQDMYRFMLWADYKGGLSYQVDRFTSAGLAFTATGIFPNATPGTTAPANTLTIGPKLWRCNNATALAVRLDHCITAIATDDY